MVATYQSRFQPLLAQQAPKRIYVVSYDVKGAKTAKRFSDPWEANRFATEQEKAGRHPSTRTEGTAA